MRVIYKRTAVKDMEATRDYIAGRLKNPKAAKKLMTALLKAISLLVDNPYMGAALAEKFEITTDVRYFCLLYTSPSPRDPKTSRMPSSA